LFVVVGQAPVMDAMLVRRVAAAEWVRESLFETVIESLVGAPAAERFVF
jgi:protein-L-isoaspartate(D-aspartate) O-methyltransferase